MGRKIKNKDEVRELLSDHTGTSAGTEDNEELDEALRETFPASDPVSMTNRLKPGARRRRHEAGS
jgi:hypothetical protein